MRACTQTRRAAEALLEGRQGPAWACRQGVWADSNSTLQHWHFRACKGSSKPARVFGEPTSSPHPLSRGLQELTLVLAWVGGGQALKTMAAHDRFWVKTVLAR